MADPCRCGWDGKDFHPCHGRGYTCRQPAKARIYNPQPVTLAGQSMKVSVEQTFACDECWEYFETLRKKRQEAEAKINDR